VESDQALNPVVAVVAFLVPPYSIYRMRGFDSTFWINTLLTAAGYILGSIHAFVVFLRASPAERARTYR
jgi:uncharacterized membrane protein YqaE (UPF0057 family)